MALMTMLYLEDLQKMYYFRIGWIIKHDDHEGQVTQGHEEENYLTRDVILHRFENSLESNQGLLGSIYNTDLMSLIINCKDFLIGNFI